MNHFSPSKPFKKLRIVLLGILSLILLLLIANYILGGALYETAADWFSDDSSAEVNATHISTSLNDANTLISAPIRFETPSVTAIRFPAVPDDLLHHVFLADRFAGTCATFTGDVLVAVIFVDAPAGSWNGDEIDEVKTDLADMTDTLLKDAARFDAQLNLSFEYYQASVDFDFPGEDIGPWIDAALADAGLSSSETVGLDLEKEFNVKEAPVIFFLNSPGRSFAQPRLLKTTSEYACIYYSDSSVSTCMHEIFHLFGAQDYYYPEDVATLAKRYLPNSIMQTGSVTDELTAYLIGWTDSFSNEAYAFLKETAYLTNYYLNRERELNTYTGYYENYVFDDGTYTGELKNGVPNGYGSMFWNDGDIYEGNWSNGWYEGEGTLYLTESGTYTGEFSAGRFSGYGTFVWLNGDEYTGEWSDHMLDGYGTYTWADGYSISGYWENDDFIG